MEKWQDFMYGATELGFHKMRGFCILPEKLKDDGSPWREKNYHLSDALCHSEVKVQILTLLQPHISAIFNMYLLVNKCVTTVTLSNFARHYLRNRSTLDIGVLGYIGVL
jgi:hypothetical protein